MNINKELPMFCKFVYAVVMAAVCFLSISIMVSMNLSDKELLVSLVIAPFLCLVATEAIMSILRTMARRYLRR